MSDNYQPKMLDKRDIFNKKFGKTVVKIHGYINHDNISAYNLIVDDKISENIDISSVYLLFELFGEHISSLIVLFENDPDGYLKKCIEVASRYCTNLLEFNFIYGKDVLSDVKNPFYNVTNVYFYYSQFESHTPNLNGLFPKMQQLVLHMSKVNNINNVLDVSIPNLVSLSVLLDNGFNDIEERKFMKLVEKNPQIQWIILRYMTTQSVKFVSTHLQNLETLILPIIKEVDYKDEIHFKHVRNFQIGKIDIGRIENITFERLEEFYCVQNQSNWMDFIAKNRNLKKISLHVAYPSHENHISLLPKIATNLIEFSFNIGFDPPVRVDTILQLLNECKHLKRLYLHSLWFNRGYLEELKFQIKDKWNFEEIPNLSKIFIERKK